MALSITMAACPKNGYLMRVEARRVGQFDGEVMAALESQALLDGFELYGSRMTYIDSGSVISLFTKKMPTVRGSMEISVAWNAEPPDNPSVVVGVRDPKHGNDNGRRKQVEDIARQFQIILVRIYGAAKVLVDDTRFSDWIF